MSWATSCAVAPRTSVSIHPGHGDGFLEATPSCRCQGSLRDAAAVDVSYADDLCYEPGPPGSVPRSRRAQRASPLDAAPSGMALGNGENDAAASFSRTTDQVWTSLECSTLVHLLVGPLPQPMLL